MEDVWITFLTIWGWFQAPFCCRVRHIWDTKSEPAQNHEQLDFCSYLLHFRHVPDPEIDAISEQVHVFVVVFCKALFWDPHFSDFCDFWYIWVTLSGHTHFGGIFSGLRKRDFPMNLRVTTWWYLGSPGGAQRRHLAKAKRLNHVAKAKWLSGLHAVGQRPGEFSP